MVSMAAYPLEMLQGCSAGALNESGQPFIDGRRQSPMETKPPGSLGNQTRSELGSEL